ncbi:MAG: hypothetical protein PHI45_00360 [Candidatus Pacebacteria bacterium]|nr:hypothetical protein [Candidatus Paceibacterota bacterium]
MISTELYLIRKLIFVLATGISTYVVLVHSKPIIESVFNKKYSIDGYYWLIVLFSLIVAIISLFIL